MDKIKESGSQNVDQRGQKLLFNIALAIGTTATGVFFAQNSDSATLKNTTLPDLETVNFENFEVQNTTSENSISISDPDLYNKDYHLALNQLKNYKSPEINYNTEQAKFLESIFENPGEHSVRIEIHRLNNKAKVAIYSSGGSVKTVETTMALPKKDKDKYLPNGYYVNASEPAKFNYNNLKNIDTTQINVAKIVDNIVLLNPINMQEIRPETDGDLIVQRRDSNPDGQRAFHSFLYEKSIVRGAAKSLNLTILDSSQATDPESGLFKTLPKYNKVIVGDITKARSHLLPDQAGNKVSWGCLRIDPVVSNKVYTANTAFRELRDENAQENYSDEVLDKDVFTENITNLPKDHPIFTTMVKVEN